MHTELLFLIYSIILGLVHVSYTGVLGVLEHGLDYAGSARDEQRPYSLRASRIVRAYSNFMQTFAFFAAAVLAVEALGIHNNLTILGAYLYFWGRLIYVPLYMFGVPYVRTVAWTGSIVGIVLLLIGIL